MIQTDDLRVYFGSNMSFKGTHVCSSTTLPLGQLPEDKYEDPSTACIDYRAKQR